MHSRHSVCYSPLPWVTILGVVWCLTASAQEAPERLPSAVSTSSTNTDERDVRMDLPAQGPLRRTEARPGNWYDVNERGEVSELLRRHWIQLDDDQMLRGRVSSLQGGRLEPTEALDVSFVQEGRVLAQTQTGPDGVFSVGGLSPGVYSVVARGRNGFLAYSINVVGRRDRQQAGAASPAWEQLAQLGRVREQLEIDSVAVPPTFRTIKNLIERYNLLDTDNSRLSPDAPGGDEAAADPAEMDNLFDEGPAEIPNGAGTSGLQAQENIEAPAASSIRKHVVYLTPNGRLVGKLTSIDFDSGRPKSVEDVTVHIIQNDRSIASAPVRRNGVFEIEDLEPGWYSLVATGRGGFGAIGFELLQRDGQAQVSSDDPFQFAVDRSSHDIHLTQGGDTPFPISLSLIDDPRDLRAALRPAAAPANAAGGGDGGFGGGLAGGGFGGGGAGGGGGGVGSGLGAALLGAGGLAAGIAAATDGGGSNNQPVSNFMPTGTPVNNTPVIDDVQESLEE